MSAPHAPLPVRTAVLGVTLADARAHIAANGIDAVALSPICSVARYRHTWGAVVTTDAFASLLELDTAPGHSARQAHKYLLYKLKVARRLAGEEV